VSGKSQDRPRETAGRRKGLSSTLQVVDGALHNWILCPITQCQQRDRRIVGVRCKGGAIDDAVTGIPPSARAYTIYQHLNTTIDPERDLFQTTARARDLI
jgi:hypothetical protein